MKFTSLQENLSKGLNIVSRAIPTKGSLPILSNVLFTTDNGRLKLSATNLETAITTYVPCSVEEEGIPVCRWNRHGEGNTAERAWIDRIQ